jgi:hypothetical protein
MNVRFTALRVTAGNHLPLFEGHVRRLGEESRGPLRHFASLATEGVYRVSWDGAQLTTKLRGPSRLVEGMPARFAVSPFAGQRGRFPKPGPPTPYEGVRVEGISTLLTDAMGEEIYESCVAGVVAWDGASLVLTPDDSPAVASVAEAELAAKVAVRRAPILVKSDWPLLLINAVAPTCQPKVPGRAAFPADQRALVDELLRR